MVIITISVPCHGGHRVKRGVTEHVLTGGSLPTCLLLPIRLLHFALLQFVVQVHILKLEVMRKRYKRFISRKQAAVSLGPDIRSSNEVPVVTFKTKQDTLPLDEDGQTGGRTVGVIGQTNNHDQPGLPFANKTNNALLDNIMPLHPQIFDELRGVAIMPPEANSRPEVANNVDEADLESITLQELSPKSNRDG